ncbi:TPA: methyltransferase domain-containing protein [Acinetobacter baumannii]|uniref:methyltransferase domain-containing protein n=1 Tax=Acinetobacter baumannii TaxID=470 RepID=UPI0002AED446|nr:methyltransferase domain-containing protein [Acinetobacter baumannii]EHU1359609.1 methyltransferase domain-containing protein [Acinetobacter baumannii]EHU3216642.1 methyltransferase domain-containing protein [Acinetobacter baumannii]ELX01421.1 methyltransferase domain protein [Acinetobacter baumannii OIFC047]EXB36034.1 methyltransferase family protein [Acinetobacter baumannii 1419130]MCT9385086.1 class I SAM-dependent methyltransferase [Acinetobacter baumannii]
MTANTLETKLTKVIRELCIDNIDKEAIWEKVVEYYNKREELLIWDDLSPAGRNHHLQTHIRENILKQGKTPCDTEELANLYTYMYMLMHIDAFNVARLKTYNYSFSKTYDDDYEEILLVDFGCGSGTIPLALAENNKSKEGFNINYLGIDIQPSMLNLAKVFLESSLFSESLNVTIDEDAIRADNHIEPKKIIFVFSYLFSQPDINKYLEKLIQRIKSIMSSHPTAEEFHLMYINKDYTGEVYKEDGNSKEAWTEFLNMLKSESMVSESLGVFSKKLDYSFRKFNNLDGNNIDKFGSLRPVYAKIFRLFKS